MADKKGNTWAGWAEAFTIFAKYDVGLYSTQAEHDEVYAGPDPEQVSTEDRQRLAELGWNENEDEGWMKFT